MAKRQQKTHPGAIYSPVSPLAPLESQRVGWGVAGFFAAIDLFWSGVTGKNHDAWYDRVLHVVGGLLILGAFVGGLILLFLERGKH
jgi:hypothetical protein